MPAIIDHCEKIIAGIAKLVRDGERNPRKQQMQKRPLASGVVPSAGRKRPPIKEAGNCRIVE